MSLIVLSVVILFSLITYFGFGTKVATGNVKGTGEDVPEFQGMIQGTGEYKLKDPMDVFVDGGEVYVSDTGNDRVVVFDKSGDPKMSFGSSGTEPGQFKFPYGISVDSDGNIYVADMYNNNISIFDKTGKFIKYFEPEDGYQFDGPSGIRIFDDKLYVPEVNSGNISVYGLDGKRELFIENSDEEGPHLDKPNGIAIDEDGKIYVADPGLAVVKVFDKKGKYLKDITGKKAGQGSAFTSPRGVVVDDNGRILVSDKIGHEIFGFSYKNKQTVSFGEMGANAEQFLFPSGMYLDNDGMIYIVDSTNGRIQMFK